MNPLQSLLNIADTSKNIVQKKAQNTQAVARKELGTLSSIADVSANVAKQNAQEKANPVGLMANEKIQNLANIPKMSLSNNPFKFENLLGQEQGGIPNLGFTQMGTQPVNMNVQPSPMDSITRDAQMVRDQAISKQNVSDDKVLNVMNKYAIDRQELFDLGSFTRKRLEEAGEDTTGLDDIDIAEYALDTAPEEEKAQYMREGIMGNIKGAFTEGIEKQAQAIGRFETGQQSGMETVSQQASATPGVVSDLLGDVTVPIISTAGELGQEAGASLGNVLRPLFGKEMLNEEEKAQRITELNQWAAEQGGNAIIPLMQEYAKLDTRTQKNLESLLPYIDLGVGVGGTTAIGKQVAKTGIQEGLETGLKKGIKAVGDIKAPSIDLNNIGDILRKSSIESVNKALNPTTKKMKQITQKIAPEVAQRGIYGDLETIGEKAIQGMEDFGAKIGEYIDANGIKGSIKTNKLTEVFDNINKDFNPGGKVVNPQIQNITDGFKNILKQYGNEIDGENAKALMKAWDNVVYSTKGGIQTEDLALSNQFRKKGADMIRGELAKANPDLAKLNKEYSFWSNLKEVVDATATRKTGQIGGLEKLATVIGGAGGLASGGIIDAIGGAAAMKYLIGFAKSPLWNSMSASWKMKIANMISKGDNNVGKEIIKVAREKKILPVSNETMSNALVLSKEGPLESRGYTQRLISPQKDIKEINLPSTNLMNGYNNNTMNNSINKVSNEVKPTAKDIVKQIEAKKVLDKAKGKTILNNIDNKKVAQNPTEALKQKIKSVQSDTLVSKADSMSNPIVNERTGETLNEAIEKMRKNKRSEKDIAKYKDAVLGKNNIKKDPNVLDTLNPTGGLYVKYDPKKRATMKLADNITTLDKTMKVSPDDEITIYRGTVKSQKDIVPGDFITTNYDLAKSYAGEGKVISKKVKASEILDDINEPLGDEYIYRPKK